VKRRLHQSNPRGPLLVRSVHHRLHQHPANPPVLRGRVNRDRAHAGNQGTLIQTIAAHNAAFMLGHDAV
jgi:hypothetical protein